MSNQDIDELNKKLNKKINLLIKKNKELNNIVQNTEPACNNCKNNLLDSINKKLEELKKEERAIAFINAKNKTPTSCVYCGLNQTADLEKYLGLIPFSIDSDEKYKIYLDQVKNTILANPYTKESKKPICSPINKKSVPKDFKLAYVYFDPIDKKYNLNQPGFAIQEKNFCNPHLNKTKKKGGKRRKSRKKRRRKSTKKKRR